MYPVLNLGQDQTPSTPVQGQPTTRPAPEPGVCCQATPDGSVVCSNGIIYMPGCPKAPEPNVPGMAQVQNGIPIPPAATACAAPATPAATPAAAPAAAGPSLILPLLGAAVGGAGLALGSYFLFFKK
jgi:hypothetical protein